jgi:kanamycin kinase
VSANLRRAYGHYTWVPVTIGHSGAAVFRLEDGTGHPQLYIKSQTAPNMPGTPSLLDESVRLVWLSEHGVPTPEVVECDRDGTEEWLITRATAGRSGAEPWDADVRGRVVDAIADFASAIHRLPVDDCPFDRTLAVSIPAAEEAATGGHADGDSLENLLENLFATWPDEEDVVVCHGDFCLPNVILDPVTLDVVGVIDVGRLGLADRYADLALMARSIGDQRLNPQFSGEYAERFLARVGARGDDERVAFYRLLDEFF